MARAADHQLLRFSQTVAEYRLPCQLLLPFGPDCPGFLPVLCEEALSGFLPEKPVSGKKGFFPRMGSL